MRFRANWTQQAPWMQVLILLGPLLLVMGQLFEIGRGKAPIVFLVLDGVPVLLIVARLVAILRVRNHRRELQHHRQDGAASIDQADH